MITEQDRRNYEGRKVIADAMREQFEEAVRVCGDGAIAYGYWVVRDKLGILPDRRFYCCRREGQSGWKPDPPDCNERLTAETHKGYEFNGTIVYPFRFTHGFQAIDDYEPLQPEQLAERRAKRNLRKVSRAIEQTRSEMQRSLFPGMYDDDLRSLEAERDRLRGEVENAEA